MADSMTELMISHVFADSLASRDMPLVLVQMAAMFPLLPNSPLLVPNHAQFSHLCSIFRALVHVYVHSQTVCLPSCSTNTSQWVPVALPFPLPLHH